MYIIKVTGETPKDVIKGLEIKLRELNGLGRSSGSVKTTKSKEVEEETEYEEVESPFEKNEPDINYGRGPVPTVDEVKSEIAAGAELDSEGIPWDGRIHSSSKNKMKNTGVWKVARGADENLVYKVKAELRGSNPTAPGRSYPRAEEALQQITPVAVPPLDVYVAPVVQAPPISAPPLPVMNTSNGHTLQTFTSNFPLIVAGLITEGKLTQKYVEELSAFFKVAQIWQANDAQIAMCFDAFVTSGHVVKVG